jgi:hypothetical protein
VRIRLIVNEEAKSDGPSDLSASPQEHDGENVKTPDDKTSHPKASTRRGILTDEAIELYREIKERAEKVGYIFHSCS